MSETTTLTAIEAGMTVGEDGDSAIAANGEAFETFSVQTMIPEGVAVGTFDASIEAIVLLSVQARFGVPPNPPTGWTIYWRVRPNYETQQTTEGKARRMRCRLTIDKP